MRRAAAVALVLLAACGPKVSITSSPFEEDDPRAGVPVQRNQFLGWEDRREAPAGPGLRTGTITRSALVAVLDRSPGLFMREFEVTTLMDGNRFVGWQFVQHVGKDPMLRGLDLVPGDVLVAINGFPLSRPDQVWTMWQSLRTADRIIADLLRGDQKFQLAFAIDGAPLPVTTVPPPIAAPSPAPSPATSTPPPRPAAAPPPSSSKK
jgi:hypothetical protein